MSEIMQARADLAKKLNVMVRKIKGITVFLLTGEKECPPTDIHFVAAAADTSALLNIYADLNFLTTEFLKPSSGTKAEEDGRIIANYTFDSGLNAEIFICGEDNLPAFDWWVSYLDQNGAADIFYADADRKSVDPTKDEPEPELSDDFENDFEESSPAPEDSLSDDFDDEAPISAPPPQEDGRWNAIYGKVNLAKHAIAGGSLIYAGEILNELRTYLIKLICERNGITSDYLHSIDLLPASKREALYKTYPAKPEEAPMIAALAAELSLFEQLLK